MIALIRYRGSMGTDLLPCFHQGLRWLLAYPAWTLGLVALGALLDALVPWLQVRAGLKDTLEVQMALHLVALLPMSLGALPAFTARVDAATLDRPENPARDWSGTLDARWLQAAAARCVLWGAVTLGLALFVVPGVVFLAAFGWTPCLVLLRGFPGDRAARGSLRIMAAHGARVLFVVLGAVLVVQVALWGLAAKLGFGGDTDLPPAQLLGRGAFWGINACSTLGLVWLDAVLLALFHRVEAPAHTPEPDDQASSK